MRPVAVVVAPDLEEDTTELERLAAEHAAIVVRLEPLARRVRRAI